MLVLTRRRDEQIVLGSGLAIVQVIDIRGALVRLGIDAPSCMEVHRREVYDAIAKAGDRSHSHSVMAEVAGVSGLGSQTAKHGLVLQFASDQALRRSLAAGFVQFDRQG